MSTDLKKRAKTVLKKLKPLYGKDPIEITYKTPFQLVVATILSAQCTDKRVNEVTATFFDRLKTPGDFLKLSQKQLEDLIRPTGFFRNKAKNILGAAQKIKEEFKGKIPDDMKTLTQIPGFGRKTANVVMQAHHKKNQGVVVDTHVLRLSKRLGFTQNKTAVAVEKDLMDLVEQKSWNDISHVLILHGRRVCFARSPQCGECVINKICPSADTKNQ